MSFEDDMYDAGYSDEEEYLEAILDKYDYEQINQKKYEEVNVHPQKYTSLLVKCADYLDFVKDNPIYEEAYKFISIENNSKKQCYKVENIFKDKFPQSDFFYLIKNEEGTKYGYCDNKGNIIFDCNYDEIYLVEAGIAIVRENSQYYCINIDGETITPMMKNRITWVNHSIIKCHKKDEAVIDLYPNNKIKDIYCTKINQHGLLVKVDGGPIWEKWVQLPSQYSFVYNFRRYLIPVKENGKWGFINNNLKEIIPCEYDEFLGEIDLSGYQNSLLQNLLVTRSSYLQLSMEEYYHLKNIIGGPEHSLPEYYYILSKKNKWGILDSNGDVVINFEYSSLNYYYWTELRTYPYFFSHFTCALIATYGEGEEPFVLDLYHNEFRKEGIILKLNKLK